MPRPYAIGSAAALLPLVLLLGACASAPEPASAPAPAADAAVSAAAVPAPDPAPAETSAAAPADSVPAEIAADPDMLPSDGHVRLVAVGDIMMGTDFPDSRYLNARLTPEVDPADLIGADLASILRRGHVVFGNMEGTLYEGSGPTKSCSNPERCYVFKSPRFHAQVLANLGFTMMSVANNHNGDFRDEGRMSTVAALEDAGIVYAGLERPGMRTGSLTLVEGVRVGLAAFAPNNGTVSIHDLDQAAQIVADLAATHDIVVVSMHAGAEGAAYTRVPRAPERFVGEDRGDVYAFAHRMVDAGATVVLGHGPHVARAVEVYKGRFIAYSLGNFWTWGRFNLRGPNGIAPVLELTLTRSGELREARLHSIRQVESGLPRLDPDAAALDLIADLTRTDFPEVPLTFAADGVVGGW